MDGSELPFVVLDAPLLSSPPLSAEVVQKQKKMKVASSSTTQLRSFSGREVSLKGVRRPLLSPSFSLSSTNHVAEVTNMYAQLIRSQWRGRGSKQGFIASRMHYTTTSKTPTTPAGRRPRVKIVEVSPRDGLQNEKRILDVDSKVELITRLASHRLSRIEAGSFVSPRVKQMANTAQVLMHPGLSVLDGQEGRGSLGEISLSVLIPNLRGWHDFANTVDSMVEEPREIAVFVAATESFSRANLNMPIASSLEAAASVAERAKTAGLRVRGYVSCVVGVSGSHDRYHCRAPSRFGRNGSPIRASPKPPCSSLFEDVEDGFR